MFMKNQDRCHIERRRKPSVDDLKIAEESYHTRNAVIWRKKSLENSKPYIHGDIMTVLTHFLKRRRADVGEILIKYGFDHLSHWKTRRQIIDLSDQYKKRTRVTVSQRINKRKFYRTRTSL
jgi:hypothetical protein